MRLPTSRLLLCTALLVSKWSLPVSAQAPAPAEQDLAKQLSNPVSSLVSMPFQFNWEQNVGPDKQTRFVLNVQPVMPFALNSDWNLIARVIVPFVSQPPLFDGGSPAFGVSDILASFFVSPSHSRIIWGVGPELSLPSTTITTLGTEKWSGSDGCRGQTDGTVDLRCALEPDLVLLRQSRSRGCQPDVPAALPVVSGNQDADVDAAVGNQRELGGRRRTLDRSDQRRRIEALDVRQLPGQLSVWLRRVRCTSGHGAFLEGAECHRDSSSAAPVAPVCGR
jgi:hypothetical protein